MFKKENKIRKIVAYLSCITLISILLRVFRNQNHLLKAAQMFYSAVLFLYISGRGGKCVLSKKKSFLRIKIFQQNKTDNKIENLKIIQSHVSKLLCNKILRKIAETFHRCFDDSL